MTTPTMATKPLPQPTELSRPYWEAAAEGRLVLQHCAACNKPRHYPRLLCDACYSTSVVWKPASGAGKIHSWTVAHHAFHPAFAADLPYTLVTVDLDEGVRALGLWCEATPVIGQSVQGRFLLSPTYAPELLFASGKLPD
ncbi:Zn-ribbon domain-containing OB-fold protein [Glaciimonas sp. GG7]